MVLGFSWRYSISDGPAVSANSFLTATYIFTGHFPRLHTYSEELFWRWAFDNNSWLRKTEWIDRSGRTKSFCNELYFFGRPYVRFLEVGKISQQTFWRWTLWRWTAFRGNCWFIELHGLTAPMNSSTEEFLQCSLLLWTLGENLRRTFWTKESIFNMIWHSFSFFV